MLYSALTKIVRPFVDLARAPRAIWYIVLAFVLDSTAYFGILTLMTTYLGRDLGWGDVYAGTTVSLFTMLVTLAMLGVGSVAESFGLRRAILFGLAVAVVGRAIYCLAPDRRVEAAFVACRDAVATELGRQKEQPVAGSSRSQPQPANGTPPNGGSSGNGNGHGSTASEKQMAYVRQLAKQVDALGPEAANRKRHQQREVGTAQ